MTGRFIYLIVKIGGFPGHKGFANEGAICEEWSLLEDRAHKAVIAVDLVTREVARRYSPAESDDIAKCWRNPKTR